MASTAVGRSSACLSRQSLGDARFPTDLSGLRPDQLAVLAGKADGLLQPAGQRIDPKCLKIVLAEVLRCLSCRGQRFRESALGTDWVGRSLKCLADDPGRLDCRSEEPGRDSRNLAPLFGQRAFGCQGRRGSDALHARGFRRRPQTAHEERHVATLSPPVGVQLVENQELQSLRLGHDPLGFDRTGKNQFQHHIVGEENVRRIGDDGFSLGVGLLAGVSIEAHRALLVGIATIDELRQLLELRVGQSVHRVDDDGLDPLAGSLLENVVDDGNDVGK